MTEQAFYQAYVYLQSGQPEQGREILSRILAQSPEHPDALNGLGLYYEQTGQIQAAENHYRQAIAISPAEPEYHNNLGILLQSQGRQAEAHASFKQALKLKPEAEGHYNLSLLLCQQGQYWQALQEIILAILQKPDWDLPQMHVLMVVSHLAYESDFLQRLRTLLDPAAGDGLWELLLGTYYNARSDTQAAIAAYRTALAQEPRFFQAYRGLISLLHDKGHYHQAISVARNLHHFKFSDDSLTELIGNLQHPLPESRQAMLEIRQELETLVDQALADLSLLQGIPNQQLIQPQTTNFYQFYQGFDDRPLQAKIARLFEAAVIPRPLPAHAPHRRPRLGIFTLRLYDHSVMHLLERALKQLLASGQFESHVFFLSTPPINRRDSLTESFQAQADHFVELAANYEQAVQQIAAAQLDLMIYPDIGMDSFTYLLACQRLAPCQVVLPGHPITTGMKQIDFFISGETLETPQAQDYYTEQLVTLPGLPDYARPEPPAPASREELLLPSTGRLYFCPMTLFKIHPDFDLAIAQILAQDPEAQLILLQFKKNLHINLIQRFAKTIPTHHERIRFLPWSSRERFYQRLQACDVILDTFYFGGGNTSYQALGLGCPIVTLDAPWNKGRWTQAMYQLMGIEGLVAKDPAEYVEIAIRLAQDKAWQTDLRQMLQARQSCLFDNPTWSEALLNFCLQQSKSSVA